MQRSRLFRSVALGGPARTLLAAVILLSSLAPAVLPRPALARAAHERPMPAFDGVTLDNERVAISDYIGRRLVLIFFNPEAPAAVPAARAVQALSSLSSSHNFAALGVAVGSSRAAAREFVQQQHLSFPVIDDSSGRITRRLGLQSQVTIVAADAEGFMIYGTSAFDPKRSDEVGRIEDGLREALRLPERKAGALAFGERPRAPLFEGVRLEGGEPFRLADYPGRPIVLIFFLHTCPHCHAALDFLVPEIAKVPEDERPLLVAVSILDRPREVREMLAQRGLEIPEVLLDSGQKLQNLYGLRGGVPDILFLDKDRRIVHRVQGWRETRDPALSRMTIAKIAGEKIPFLLNPRGYTGNDVCAVCHQLEVDSWHYTKHADAYDTLVTHGSERDPECVGCHVVGFDQPGGWTIDEAPAHLEDVGCESCHGRGGPHLSKDFVKDGNYEPVCKTCHDPTHSLGFDYDSFRKNISHIQIAAMTPEQREALGGSRPGNLLPVDLAYVGSDACKSCHPSEFATWVASPHAHSLASLEVRKKSRDAKCLTCHTTAFGKPGGFPTSAASDPQAHPDLARVGCESCHGPGEAHVAPDAKRLGTIISLGDKCDSCVILQICGGCHDDDNDPGFAFEVLDKIEHQRHGTIEAGTGKPLPSASRQPPASLLADRVLRQIGE